MGSDGPVQSWLRLEGKIAPEILRAPKTGGDQENERGWTPVHERSVHYLEQYVVGKPWANHLALIVAVLSARHYDTHTVESMLNTLHVRFAALFAALHLETMDAWDAEPSMIAYLKWEVLPDDTQDMRTRFCDLYNRGAKQVKSWIEALPDAVQPIYQRFLLPLEPLYAAVTFGLLAIDLFTTTGMRVNEAMQVRLTEDCFVRLQMQAPPGAKDQSPRVRFAFRLIPKGERTDTPQDYFIGKETKRLLVKVARMLAEHYHLEAGASLPAVPFYPLHTRAHRFGTAPYLFQYGNQHLHDQAITACMRFLLHGMAFRTRDGDQVTVKPHLLRHAFATYAVQVEKIPLDIVGAMLKQKNLNVTAYYSQVTPGMIADAHDGFLAGFAAQINVGEAVQRSPEELQQLIEEAQGKAGTFAEVMGGQCVMHGFCGAKFVCIGCPGKVPDPAKRAQVEKHMEWAGKQVQYATEEGLYPEAERMKQVVRDCATEIREKDQIEAYRKDEQRVPLITISPRKRRE